MGLYQTISCTDVWLQVSDSLVQLQLLDFGSVTVTLSVVHFAYSSMTVLLAIHVQQQIANLLSSYYRLFLLFSLPKISAKCFRYM